jgi:hypothetical protein
MIRVVFRDVRDRSGRNGHEQSKMAIEREIMHEYNELGFRRLNFL